MRKEIRLLVESFFDDEIFNQKDDINQVIQDVGDRFYSHQFFPKDFDELRSLLEELLDERGKDADLNDIDVSQITTFYNKDKNLGLFEKLDPHNIKIDRWDVSNVRDMHNMFFCCENFTGKGLKNWYVDAVVDMYGMFYRCFKFNANLSNWNVRQVENMRYMFSYCQKFNCNLSNWDVSNVEDMSYMFDGCKKFSGQGLENWKPIKCQDMDSMFYGCENFNCNLSNWDVSNVKNMNKMFYKCSKFNCDLHSWKIYQLDAYYRKDIFNGCCSLKNPRKYLIKSKK